MIDHRVRLTEWKSEWRWTCCCGRHGHFGDRDSAARLGEKHAAAGGSVDWTHQPALIEEG